MVTAFTVPSTPAVTSASTLIGPSAIIFIPYGNTGSDGRVTVASVSGHVLVGVDGMGDATCATDNPKRKAAKIVMQRLFHGDADGDAVADAIGYRDFAASFAYRRNVE